MGNKTWFTDLFTCILFVFPTLLPCLDLTPVRWFIAGKWYCATPKMQGCRAKEKLNLTVQTYESLGDLTKGLGKDIYSDSQKVQHLSLVRSLQARDLILRQWGKQGRHQRHLQLRQGAEAWQSFSNMTISNLHNLPLGHLFLWIPKVVNI